MSKGFLWAIALVVGLPAAIFGFCAFLLLVLWPWQHDWNVRRMDARNDAVWQTAEARVVTVAVDLDGTAGHQTRTARIVCYNGWFAEPFTLKNGPPRIGRIARSVGFAALQTPFPTGATLDIELRYLCGIALHADPADLALPIPNSELAIVPPGLSAYCHFRDIDSRRDDVLHTDAARVSRPRIIAFETHPLRTVARRTDIGSSDATEVRDGFRERWGTGMDRSLWLSAEACWTEFGRCSGALTRFCGNNPRGIGLGRASGRV